MVIKDLIQRVVVPVAIVSILSIVTHYTVYYRFTPNYVPGVFSESGFQEMYEQSVFKYRIVGIRLQLFLYKKIKDSGIDIKENRIYNKRLHALDGNADPYFYATYFIINTASCTLTAILLLLIYNYGGLYNLNRNEKIISIAILILFIGLTQFAITPYDNLSYASLALSFYLFLVYEQKKNIVTYTLLSASILFATLIRESSIILITTITTVYIAQVGFNFKLLAKKLWLPCFAFLTPYVGVRYYLSGTAEIVQSITLFRNFFYFESASNLIALAFAVTLFYLLWQYASTGNLYLFKLFILLSVPYLAMVIIAGLLIEFRLWVPIVIGTLLLCRLDMNKLSRSVNERI